MNNSGYKAIELFAGIGGFRLACDKLSIKTIWANDIDPKAVKVYKDNFGENSIIQGDINNLIDDIPNHDILTGGFPCQPFSKAGKKQGIDDYRGTLFEAIVKIVKLKQPKYFILENVSSLLFMQNGRHYRTILSALSDLGYKIEWRIINAIEFNLPQNRERVIILGAKERKINESYFLTTDNINTLDDQIVDKIAKYKLWDDIITSNKEFNSWGMAYEGKFVSIPINHILEPQFCLNDILEENVPESFDFTEDTLKRIENSVHVDKYHNGVQILYNQRGGARMGYSIFGTCGVAPTLTASTSRHYERYMIKGKYRRLTNIEYARLQGFPDLHCKAVSAYDQYKLYGNAVPHQIIHYALSKMVNDNYITITSPILQLFD